MDLPDSQANARVFGYPASCPGTKAAFPKVCLVMLVEAGTHLIVDALMCTFSYCSTYDMVVAVKKSKVTTFLASSEVK